MLWVEGGGQGALPILSIISNRIKLLCLLRSFLNTVLLIKK